MGIYVYLLTIVNIIKWEKRAIIEDMVSVNTDRYCFVFNKKIIRLHANTLVYPNSFYMSMDDDHNFIYNTDKYLEKIYYYLKNRELSEYIKQNSIGKCSNLLRQRKYKMNILTGKVKIID